MSGPVLLDAIQKGFRWDLDRIITGSQDVSLMRSPIYTGMQSESWISRKHLEDLMTYKDRFGNAAIHHCIIHSRPEFMNALLSAGANPNLQGMGGYTPAAIACSNNQYECLCVLLDAKVDVNEIDESEWHLLHHCTSEGSKESLCELLSRDGCLLDHVSDKGYTPLMIACIKGDCEMIFELVAAGANCTIKHKRTEESALNLATNKNARDAMERGTIEMNIRRKKLDVEEAERNKYRSSLEKLQTEEETSPDSVK